MTWSRPFDAPIALPDGGELTTLRQAGEYITALPATKHYKPHWQIATQHLMAAAERDGIVMLADIALRQALTHDRPRPEHAPRKKLAERYKASADTEPPVSRRARRLDASAVG
jgi:hypothetical protein